MSTPAGWFPQPDGRQRYWDGEAWTDDFAPVVAAVVPPRKRWFTKKWIIIPSLVLLLFVGLGAIGRTPDPTTTKASSTSAADQAAAGAAAVAKAQADKAAAHKLDAKVAADQAAAAKVVADEAAAAAATAAAVKKATAEAAAAATAAPVSAAAESPGATEGAKATAAVPSAPHTCPTGQLVVVGQVATSQSANEAVNVTVHGTVTNRTTSTVTLNDDDPPDLLALDSLGNTVGMVWLGQFDYGRTDGLPKRGSFFLKPGQSMPFTIDDGTVISGPVAKWYLSSNFGEMWRYWSYDADFFCPNPSSSNG